MTTPFAYNQWLGNQFVIPELPPVTPYTVTPPTVDPVQQQMPVPMYVPRRQQGYGGYEDGYGGSVPSPIGSGFGLPTPSMPSWGELNNARNLGIGGLLSGVPGLGILGAGIGSAIDATNANAQAMNSYGTRGVSALSAFGNAITGGLLGNSAAGQLSDIGYEASFTPEGTFGAYGYEPDNTTALTMDDLEAMQSGGGYSAGSDYGAATTAADQEAAMAEGSAPDSSGGGSSDKIICTELYRQGKLPRHIYENDAQVGREYAKNDPLVMKGYHVWGRPVAKLMAHSRVVTAVVEPFAKAWAFHIAGQKSLLGAVLFNVGVPICRIIGYALKGNARVTRRNLAASG